MPPARRASFARDRGASSRWPSTRATRARRPRFLRASPRARGCS